MTQAHEKLRDPEVVLRLEGVSKVYSGTVAVRQADFEVRRGAVNVLVGENGAGKSTLMKIVAGVERPTAGRIVLEGETVVFSGTADAMSHGIGMVFQELNLFGNLSVAENVFANREISSRLPGSGSRSPSSSLPIRATVSVISSTRRRVRCALL